ncbi:MAG: helix-turn-helix transcriptional regulator [Luteolibacter sp.]
MFLPVFQDLIRPQWRAVLEELKLSGGLPVSELARRVDASYMAVKQHCEELKKLGYLERSRIPRTAVGRPEIFYSLGAKSDALFPQAGGLLTLDLLQDSKALFGENTPDKLFFQHFQKQHEKWLPIVSNEVEVVARAARLVTLRNKEGCFGRTGELPDGGWCIEEFHNPMQRIFEVYPRASAMELRMIEQLLGARVTRREISGGRSGQPRVIFEFSAAPAK